MAHHARTPSNGRKALPAHARPSKPPALKRALSQGASRSQKGAATVNDADEDDLMAASFLQFCATCEKQIVVPNNSILYCSENCRRKDKIKNPANDPTPPSTPYRNFSFDDMRVRDIVPQRSPTAPSSNRISWSEPSEDESHSEDDYRESEAARYLRQFKSPNSTSTALPSRPRLHRSMTSTTAVSTAPSLSHTPTSTASMSMPYTPSARPLPQRKNPFSSSCKSGSVDLVTPFAYTPVTAPSSFEDLSRARTFKSQPTTHLTHGMADGEMMYEKSTIRSIAPGQGSLKQLFAFSDMRRPPSSAEFSKMGIH